MASYLCIMAKSKTKTGEITFACRECGDTFSKWTGKCPSCGSWDSLIEFKDAPTATGARGLGAHATQSPSLGGQSGAAARMGLARHGTGPNQVMLLKDVPTTAEERMHTGSREFDRVLGGGVVRGSLVLIGGDPGIGKSTLLLQVVKSPCSNYDCEHLGSRLPVRI
jgi:DNA repair protein RadA/Sms